MKERETLIMFSPNLCSEPGCHIYALKGSDRCLHHSPDGEEAMKAIREDLERCEEARDFSFVGAEFSDMVIKDKTIAGCNFAFCVFERCRFENTKIIASFFDYALFRDTVITDSEIRYSVFAGSLFMNSSIEESTAIHNNFIGIDAYDSVFSHNDFYYSNFAVSKLLYTKMEDCNLKRADFSDCLMKEVSFRYSNSEDALFPSEECY